MLGITTPYGNRYVVHENGDIQRTDLEHKPSGNWKMLGIKVVRGSLFLPLAKITQEWLNTYPLLYKNGNPRYTVMDLDHGTRREWGNTKYHGIRSITLSQP